MVGETEESCRQKGIDYCVGRALYRDQRARPDHRATSAGR